VAHEVERRDVASAKGIVDEGEADDGRSAQRRRPPAARHRLAPVVLAHRGRNRQLRSHYGSALHEIRHEALLGVLALSHVVGHGRNQEGDPGDVAQDNEAEPFADRLVQPPIVQFRLPAR
jgi:hypothetical protein